MYDLIPVLVAEDCLDFAAFVADKLCHLGVGVCDDPPGEFSPIRPADLDAVPPVELPLHPGDAGGEETPPVPGKNSTGTFVDKEPSFGAKRVGDPVFAAPEALSGRQEKGTHFLSARES